MNSVTDPSCANCIFQGPAPIGVPKILKTCRRTSPGPHGFPKVMADQVCGKWMSASGQSYRAVIIKAAA